MDYLTAGVSAQEDIQAAQRHQQQGNTQLAIQSYESVNIVCQLTCRSCSEHRKLDLDLNIFLAIDFV